MDHSPLARPVRLTAIVPATNRPATLSRCVHAIASADAPPEQVIVVLEPAMQHVALARNAAARGAVGDVLVFVDADVTVHADAFARVRRAFDADSALVALFGSYDDAPSAPGSVSLFRNLLHHHVHQQAPGVACTFWTGLGAVRRRAFEACGGFVEHPLEDVELGMRLFESDARIVLDPRVQGSHLKQWSVWTMLRTDLCVRGIPWIGLLLAHPTVPATTLNLGWRHRLSAIGCLALVMAALFLQPLVGAVALLTVLSLNLSFYRLLARRGGMLRAANGVALHVLHHLVAVLAVPLGVAIYAAHRTDRRLHALRLGVLR